jgi:predicted lipoprotein with Yx(FWY)xxD motif
MYMKRKKLIVLVVVVVLALSAGVVLFFQKRAGVYDGAGNRVNFVRSGVVGYVKSASLGEYLTDKRGITLYVYADDKKLQSTCSGNCLKLWLPAGFDPNDRVDLSTDTLSEKINSAKASDGSRQYAFGDKPLYYYLVDENPGDVNGNGLDNGKWSIVPITK